MPSARQRRRRAELRTAELALTQSQPGNGTGADGKQARTADPQMQQTAAERHGKQSERAAHSEPRQTARLINLGGKDNLVTKLEPLQTHQHSSTSTYRKSIPGTQATVDTFGTQYSLSAKGLSELQIKRACDKAWLQTFHNMQLVPDATYDQDTIELFQTTVRDTATRIMEAKRRRCARSKRQPSAQP